MRYFKPLFFVALSLLVLGACRRAEPSLLQVCAGICYEAESADLYGLFRIEALDQASDGFYVTTPQPNEAKIADLIQLADKSQRIELPFQLDAGSYAIKIWVAGEDDSDDSFYIQLDDEAYITHHFSDIVKEGRFPAFTTDYLLNSKGERRRFVLSEGRHKLTFYLRETGARLDRVEFEPLEDSQ